MRRSGWLCRWKRAEVQGKKEIIDRNVFKGKREVVALVWRLRILPTSFISDRMGISVY